MAVKKGKKDPCRGVVREERRGNTKIFTLECTGDCDEGKCKTRKTKPDHHGTYIEYCGCDDDVRTCNIYIETDGRGNKRIDCFTLGCGKSEECTLVELSSAESEGIKIIKWGCACKPTKN